MFDIDAGYAPIIRLDALREAIDADQAEAIAHREMTEATMRWIDARMKAQALRDQSRPVSASDAALSGDNDFWTHRHRVLSGTTPMIARSAGHIDRMTAAAAGEIEDSAAPLRKAHDGTHVIRDFLKGLGFDPKDAGAVKDRT